jgi:hypothetical protein
VLPSGKATPGLIVTTPDCAAAVCNESKTTVPQVNQKNGS